MDLPFKKRSPFDCQSWTRFSYPSSNNLINEIASSGIMDWISYFDAQILQCSSLIWIRVVLRLELTIIQPQTGHPLLLWSEIMLSLDNSPATSWITTLGFSYVPQLSVWSYGTMDFGSLLHLIIFFKAIGSLLLGDLVFFEQEDVGFAFLSLCASWLQNHVLPRRIGADH